MALNLAVGSLRGCKGIFIQSCLVEIDSHSIQYNKLADNLMARGYRDLPIHSDYTPNGDSARNPPLSTEEFAALFYSCEPKCHRLLPHHCFTSLHGTRHLDRIPKRKTPFITDTTSDVVPDPTDEITHDIWGLGAVHSVSFAYVCAYHIAIIAGPFAFFVWWITSFPTDLQNASVPVTIVLGLLSLFHSGSGIWTSRKDR
jgi:hypothetical protein